MFFSQWRGCKCSVVSGEDANVLQLVVTKVVFNQSMEWVLVFCSWWIGQFSSGIVRDDAANFKLILLRRSMHLNESKKDFPTT